jgi:hypothetical protein
MIQIELCIDTAALAPEEQTILGLLSEMPPATLFKYLLVLHHWQQASASRRAIALKLLDGRLHDKEVARLCGLSDRQLRRYREYREFARLLRKEDISLPRGAKSSDGDIEAWDPQGERTRIRKLFTHNGLRHTTRCGPVSANPWYARTYGF